MGHPCPGRDNAHVQAGAACVSGAVVLVLLIGIANVANLQLARSVRRGDEFAIRSALGASRSRVRRQLFAEGLVLALLGGMAGAIVARLSIPLLVRQLPHRAAARRRDSLRCGELRRRRGNRARARAVTRIGRRATRQERPRHVAAFGAAARDRRPPCRAIVARRRRDRAGDHAARERDARRPKPAASTQRERGVRSVAPAHATGDGIWSALSNQRKHRLVSQSIARRCS